MRVEPADLDESACLRKKFGRGAPSLKTARQMAETLARAKAQAVADKNPRVQVLGSDQLLWVDGQILGKPKTESRARRMLASCSGKKAYLITSVALVNPKVEGVRKTVKTKTQTTVLVFAKLTSADISRIIKLDQPLWCAGSFMFEKHGATLFETVQTDDPSGIEGFPVMRVIRLLSFD